jgi:hypothetical protein
MSLQSITIKYELVVLKSASRMNVMTALDGVRP